jgi:hypothetical protein
MRQNTVSKLLEGQVALANVQPLSTTDVFRKRASRGGVVLAWPHSSSGPQSRNLLHWIALLLCSEKRPVRKGQILPRSDVGTVKYLSCGRNIGQQETKLSQQEVIREALRLRRPQRLPQSSVDLAGIATSGAVGANEFE